MLHTNKDTNKTLKGYKVQCLDIVPSRIIAYYTVGSVAQSGSLLMNFSTNIHRNEQKINVLKQNT